MKVLRALVASAAAVLLAGAAHATTFNLVNAGATGPGNGGNYCVNFKPGDGTTACNVDGSPWIVKYDYDENAQKWNLTEFNTYFGSATDFGGITISSAGGGMWSWTYNNDGDDPGITAFAAKGSNAHNLYKYAGAGAFMSGGPVSFMFPQGNSNVTFFDSVGVDTYIPLPAAGWMLIGGIGGLAALRRKKKAA